MRPDPTPAATHLPIILCHWLSLAWEGILHTSPVASSLVSVLLISCSFLYPYLETWLMSVPHW